MPLYSAPSCLKLYQSEHNDELIVISLFYCCPQVTVASKFLILQESVRDAADLPGTEISTSSFHL